MVVLKRKVTEELNYQDFESFLGKNVLRVSLVGLRCQLCRLGNLCCFSFRGTKKHYQSNTLVDREGVSHIVFGDSHLAIALRLYLPVPLVATCQAMDFD